MRSALPSSWPLRSVAALFALSLATFSFVTTENLPVGLLPQIASDLHRSKSTIGLLVTGYAAVVVLSSIPLALATRRIPRRQLLVVTLTVFVLATWAGAAAPDYRTLLLTRMAIALSHSVFWAVNGPTAAGLFNRELRGRALGVLFAGASLATVIGIPLTTWLGQNTSWRVATIAVGALGLVALVTVGALLPTAPPDDGGGARAAHPNARRYALTLLTLGLAITGTFTVLTYVTAFLTGVSGFSSGAISPILFVQGIAGVGGVAVAAVLIVRRPRLSLIGPVALLTLSMLALFAVGHVKPATIACLAVFGFALSAFAASVQARTLDSAPGNSHLASAGNSAVFNIGIGGGALVGSLLLPGVGVRSIALVGGFLAGAALLVLLVEPRLVRRGPLVGRGSLARRGSTPTRS